MGWVRIDDGFDEHPKLQRVGPLAWGYWLAGLAYCNRNLTDGFIPWTKARSLCSFEVVVDDGQIWDLTRSSGYAGEDITAEWLIGLLIDAGLWNEVMSDKGRIEGYRVHDYPDYQPLKAQVEEIRAAKSEAGKKGADSRWHGKPVTDGMAGAIAEEWQGDGKSMPQTQTLNRTQTLNPKPTPEASPIGLERAKAKPTPKPRNHQIPDDWAPSQGVVRVAQELHMDLPAMQSELDKFASHFRANGKVMADWNQAAMNWLRRSLDFAGPPNSNGKPKGPDFAARAIERRRLEQETEL